MNFEEAVERNPEIMSGALCFRGTRVPVSTLIDHVEANQIEEFFVDFPGVTREMVEVVMKTARQLLEDFVPPAKGT